VIFARSFTASTATSSSSNASPFSSFGAVETNNIIQASKDRGILANVVLANTPQLVITFLYLFYNDAFTRMLMSHEYSRFASVRQALRVSQPRGQQRSTYWLQVPYRYSIPMMSCTAVLHWLISRSIFLVRINIYDVFGQPDPERDVDACGFSPLAILLATLLLTAMTVVLFGLGRFRHLDPGMPVASSCSAAISAAAHPADAEPADISTSLLQYGVVPDTEIAGSQYLSQSYLDLGGERNLRRSYRRHVGFSTLEVTPLESGIIYW
jgi:hypothetical protein